MKNPLRWTVLVITTIAVPLAAACGSGDGANGEETAADTLTRRQKDSLISTMPVPGAGAVGKALEASDKLRERAEQHDTIR